MSKKSNEVKILEVHSGEILWQGSMDALSDAYEYAAKLENMGLDVKLEAPTVTQSLIENLGLNAEEKEEFEESLLDEIHDHDGSCCTQREDKGS